MKRRRALRVCRSLSLSLSVTLARQLHMPRKGVDNDFLKRYAGNNL